MIEPYPHRRLESFAVESGDRFGVVVRECGGTGRTPSLCLAAKRVDAATFDLTVSAATEWPLNVVVVVVDERARTVTLRAGGWGSAPLYVVGDDDRLSADWDAARLYPRLRSGLDPARAIYSLVHIGYSYSRLTAFADLLHLTERSTLTWTAGHSRLEGCYPRPIPRVKPRPLADGADVVGGFAQILRYAVSIWADERTPLATQLSGGIDSSGVAAALAGYDTRQVRSYGLIMPGANGVHQAQRRDELVKVFGLADTTLPAASFLPFSPTSSRTTDGSLVPWSEYYYDAIGRLSEHAVADGADVLYTGLGGDELSTLMRGEEDPASDDEPHQPRGLPPFLTAAGVDAYRAAAVSLELAPAAAVERSCIEAAATNADGFLRRGLWPAYPYCAPDLVEFCRSLPAQWRRDRTLQRVYLRRRGCSDRVARPRVMETFAEVMTMAIRQGTDTLVPLLAESRLAEAGLVDRDAVLASYAGFADGSSEQWKDCLLELAVLELTERAVAQARLVEPRPDEVHPSG